MQKNIFNVIFLKFSNKCMHSKLCSPKPQITWQWFLMRATLGPRGHFRNLTKGFERQRERERRKEREGRKKEGREGRREEGMKEEGEKRFWLAVTMRASTQHVFCR
jgi:hypothetical protein